MCDTRNADIVELESYSKTATVAVATTTTTTSTRGNAVAINKFTFQVFLPNKSTRIMSVVVRLYFVQQTVFIIIIILIHLRY